MKIKKITVQNFKAISDLEVDFNGCSAIVTGGNNRGKSSLLSGLISRLQGEKPELIVKQGEDKGLNIIELTDGSKIEWTFTERSEKLAFTTKEGIKMTSGVISAISEKYFGRKFDIDAFLNKSPKNQSKELQIVLGLDLEKLDAEHAEAYAQRTEANRELKRLRAINMEKPQKIDKPDVESIKKELNAVREENNKTDELRMKKYLLENQLRSVLNAIVDTEFYEFFDRKKAQAIIDEIKVPEEIYTSGLEEKLDEANYLLRKYDMYERDLAEYNKWVQDGKDAKEEADRRDKAVKDIEKKKQDLIASAKMPEGFEMGEDGLLYNGFPLSERQISQSAKYIAALKLGEMILGSVRTLHFDASSLDNVSLKEVQEWADTKDLQLLIERPDLSGGEIKYELIQEKS